MSRRLIAAIRNRLEGEGGFTMIELLVVVEIIGILTVVAVPSYLSMSAKARTVAAQSNVSSAVAAANVYYMDTVQNPTPGTYGGLSGAKLRLETPGIGANVMAGSKTVTTSHDAFCLQDSEDGGKTFYSYQGGKSGTGVVALGACPAAYTVS